MSELAAQQAVMNRFMFSSRFTPKGNPPSPKLTSTSSSEEVMQFFQDFQIFIQGAKVMEKIDLPLNVVVGCLAKHVETNFFSTTLRQFIINNTVDKEIPGHTMEESVHCNLKRLQ